MLYRQVQKLQLVALYKADEEISLFVRQIDALAFLPLGEVEDAFKELRDRAPKELDELVDFFGVNYVLGRLKVKGKLNIQQLRVNYLK
jgi:hypothetical protein